MKRIKWIENHPRLPTDLQAFILRISSDQRAEHGNVARKKHENLAQWMQHGESRWQKEK